jgi:hypothetical protein
MYMSSMSKVALKLLKFTYSSMKEEVSELEISAVYCKFGTPEKLLHWGPSREMVSLK